MRSLLLGAASIAALLGSASIAQADTAGYVDISAGQLDLDGFNLDSISIGGAAAADVSQNWRAQFDGNISRFSDGGDAISLGNAAGHLYYESGNWALGGVLSYTDLSFASIWALGLEGQVHIGRVVLEGEAGLGTLEAFGASIDTTNADANATFYLSDNFSIGAGATYLDSDDAFGVITTYGLDAEYQFAGGSNSVFAGYDNTSYDDIDVDSDSWRIGFRHAFGADSLQGRRQSGPRWLPTESNLALFGLGPSDRRVKRDITLLMTLENGMNIYSFRYLWSETVHVGVMAQDLLLNPQWRSAAVKQANGFYAVNYAALGLRMTSLEEWNRAGLVAILFANHEHGALRRAA